ncbi:NUDIX domain-containing protein [Brevibacillus migulae]|uniref:NUDIX domain-containing protein n=1 Tax=Brevibacillus migulae TaxID=1644114 RepID=UPI00106E5FB7|nr:NUDIX domain-containing protein [Brevibacillus migulae]
MESSIPNQTPIKKYRTPDGYTSDIAVFTIVNDEKPTLKLMLIKRTELNAEGEPNVEGGKWALPGGFVQPHETAYEAALRELKEETGVDGFHVKHFGVFDKPGRDPRGWIISNAHYAIVPNDYLEARQAADDAQEVELFSVDQVCQLSLAFDHREIIEEAMEWIKRDMVQTTLARSFLPPEFTISELQSVILAVVQDPQVESKPAFFAKAQKLPFIEVVLEKDGQAKTTQRNSSRPAKLYRFNDYELVKSIYR